MKKYYTSSIQLFRQIGSDYMLIAVFFVPLIVGCLIRFGVPALENALTGYFQTGQILTTYYPLFDLFLSMIAPIMFCFSFAMIMLEEIDDKVARYFIITPLGKGGYLFSRVGLPAVISLLFTPVLLWVFRISDMSVLTLLTISLLGSMLGTIVSLMIVSLSTNKLEGMAATKMSALLTLGILPPFFIKGNVEYLFGILPSYWLSKVILEQGILPFAIGLLVSGVWIVLLARKFNKKVSV